MSTPKPGWRSLIPKSAAAREREAVAADPNYIRPVLRLADPVMCARCYQVGEPVKKEPGSAAAGCLLTLLFIVPGIIYFFWRSANAKPVCRHCGAADIVPINSPRAAEIRARMEGRA